MVSDGSLQFCVLIIMTLFAFNVVCVCVRLSDSSVFCVCYDCLIHSFAIGVGLINVF